MNRKFLENELSVIEDENVRKSIIDNIMKENGTQIETHKTEVATLKNDLKVKDGVIDNLNTKIKEYTDMDIEQIKKEQFDLGKAEGNKEVETFKKNTALKDALKNAKAKDIDLLSKLLSNDDISYEEKDGKYEIKGLDEQINKIKESHDYLFEKEPDGNQRINTGDNFNKPGEPGVKKNESRINPMFKTY